MSKFDFEVILTNDFTLVVRPVDSVQLDPYRQEFTFPHEVLHEFMREISEDDLLGEMIDVLIRTSCHLEDFRNEIYGKDEM